MNGWTAVFRREWRTFTGSDRGVFTVYGIIVVVWSFLFVTNLTDGSALVRIVWLATFAIVTTSNFSQVSLVSERTGGALEVLLTCGLSRGAILGGKIAFVSVMSSLMGYACIGLSSVWLGFAGRARDAFVPGILVTDLAVFAAASFMNAASAAWLSVALPNPRLLHFVNFAFAAVVLSLFFTVSSLLPVRPWTVSPLFFCCGCLFAWRARRAFDGEKVVHPVAA